MVLCGVVLWCCVVWCAEVVEWCGVVWSGVVWDLFTHISPPLSYTLSETHKTLLESQVCSQG